MKKYLLQKNYSGIKVISGAGIVLVAGSVPVWILFGLSGFGSEDLAIRLVLLSLLIGGAAFIDDLAGSGQFRGFKGHFDALCRGFLTTGAFKAAVSAATVSIVFAGWRGLSLMTLVEVMLVLSVINLFNLLDLRPGRTLKVFIFFSLIIALSFPIFQLYFLPLYIIIILYLPFELREQVMLGDTGANFLGLVVGFSLAVRVGSVLKLTVLFFSAALNLLSERYSFTEIIAGNRVLSFLDQLGRVEKREE
ncbi:MAG: hypothetical protein ACOCQC_01225 [Halanaerobiaceae bacterium]